MSDTLPFDLPAPFKVSRLISGLWVSQAIYVAAALGVADALAAGPRSSAEIARAVGAHPGALLRLMRALVVLELCAQTGAETFELTATGQCLRSDVRDSVRSWALLWGGERTMHTWGRLVDAVRTGASVPELEGRGSTFDELASDPARLAEFHRSMVEMTKPLAAAIPLAYDFSGIGTIVDVGGGYGQLLPPILARYPEMRGIVFDLPHCRDGALRTFEKTRLADRCEFVGGSFFDGVPRGGDAYILKSVIHDWNDDASVRILKACRAAMHDAARLLLVEPVVPTRMGSSAFDEMVVSADLNMLVAVGGCERTEAEFGELYAAAGLRLTQVVPTIAMLSVIAGSVRA